MKKILTILVAITTLNFLTGCMGTDGSSATMSSLLGVGADIAYAMAGNDSNGRMIRQVSSSLKRAANQSGYQQRQQYPQRYPQQQTPRYDGRHTLYYNVHNGDILHVESNPNRQRYLDPVLVPVDPYQQQRQQRQYAYR